ncbi:AbrB/MazE/SpoVT family DNA-binding domain-containing protein [Rhodoblastus sp.]|uniref:AbrB/MazE/SpoVT family DNA-binding domain-containing protein n=1 Tax=Rhodoblastus sp. TaxID=1962975 RepID=UPI003F9E167E
MQVSRWGNSLAVRLPKTLVERLGLRAGDEIEILAAQDKRLVVAKQHNRARALANIKARGWKAPPGYKFDRDEANER